MKQFFSPKIIGGIVGCFIGVITTASSFGYAIGSRNQEILSGFEDIKSKFELQDNKNKELDKEIDTSKELIISINNHLASINKNIGDINSAILDNTNTVHSINTEVQVLSAIIDRIEDKLAP